MRTTCPLCGFAYEPGDAACRASGCPLAGSACRRLHCPRCGYEVPDESASALARWVRRAFGGQRTAPGVGLGTALRLTEAPTGTRGAISRVEAPPALCAQLAAQGIVAGTVLHLAQRHPAFVVEVGESALAIERAVASAVWIQPGDPSITAERSPSA